MTQVHTCNRDKNAQMNLNYCPNPIYSECPHLSNPAPLYTMLATNFNVNPWIHLWLRFATWNKRKFKVPPFGLPLFDLSVVSGSQLNPVLREHPGILSVLLAPKPRMCGASYLLTSVVVAIIPGIRWYLVFLPSMHRSGKASNYILLHLISQLLRNLM
jgi:hypothetical protein